MGKSRKVRKYKVRIIPFLDKMGKPNAKFFDENC